MSFSGERIILDNKIYEINGETVNGFILIDVATGAKKIVPDGIVSRKLKKGRKSALK